MIGRWNGRWKDLWSALHAARIGRATPAWRPLTSVAALFAVFAVLPAAALELDVTRDRDRDDDAPPNVVYVESNIGEPGKNSIFGFHRDASGSLTPLSGSPYLTGGTGVFDLSLALGPFDSDQNIIVTPNHRRLFAVNSGSNTIAVFDIRENGSLVPVNGSPFPSGGVNPVSVGLADDLLTVVNKNQDPNQDQSRSLPNYTTFRVTPHGRLIAIPHSTVSVPHGSSPTQALVSPDEEIVFGADFMGGVLQSFILLPNGRLFQNPPQPLPASEFAGSPAPHFPLGLQVHPRRRVLYAGFVTINRLGVYTYNSSGVLSFVRTVPNSGGAICWLVANRGGTRLYTSNTGDNSVSVYDLSNPTFPVEIQHVVLNGNGNPLQLALDSSGSFLHVVSQRATPATPLGEGNVLHVLRVDPVTGLLVEAPSSPTILPVPAGTRSQGVAAL